MRAQGQAAPLQVAYFQGPRLDYYRAPDLENVDIFEAPGKQLLNLKTLPAEKKDIVVLYGHSANQDGDQKATMELFNEQDVATVISAVHEKMNPKTIVILGCNLGESRESVEKLGVLPIGTNIIIPASSNNNTDLTENAAFITKLLQDSQKPNFDINKFCAEISVKSAETLLMMNVVGEENGKNKWDECKLISPKTAKSLEGGLDAFFNGAVALYQESGDLKKHQHSQIVSMSGGVDSALAKDLFEKRNEAAQSLTADDKRSYLNSALRISIRHREKSERVGTLLEKGADANAIEKETGLTPLSTAISKGKYDIVKQLIDHKANVNHKDETNETPLLLASYFNKKDLVKLLVKAGANEEKFPFSNESSIEAKKLFGQRTNLFAAASNGNSQKISTLVRAGIDIDMKNGLGQTVFEAFPNFSKQIKAGYLHAQATQLVEKGVSITTRPEAPEKPSLFTRIFGQLFQTDAYKAYKEDKAEYQKNLGEYEKITPKDQELLKNFGMKEPEKPRESIFGVDKKELAAYDKSIATLRVLEAVNSNSTRSLKSAFEKVPGLDATKCFEKLKVADDLASPKNKALTTAQKEAGDAVKELRGKVTNAENSTSKGAIKPPAVPEVKGQDVPFVISA